MQTLGVLNSIPSLGLKAMTMICIAYLRESLLHSGRPFPFSMDVRAFYEEAGAARTSSVCSGNKKNTKTR